MPQATLTSANAAIFLSIAGLYSAPQQLQGFAADDVFSTDPINSVETQMGVDGIFSGGFVFVPIRWGIDLQANSPSNDIFDNWAAQQIAQLDAFIANGIVSIPALGKKWTMTRGFLSDYKPMPDARKTLQPRKYMITWGSISPANT